MSHKYLNKLGIKSNDWSMFNARQFPSIAVLKQKWTHGFATWREVSNLDCTSAMWLYEHIKVYVDEASEIVDFDADPKRYSIPVLHDLEEIEYYKDLFPIATTQEIIEEHTQLEAIDYIIHYLEYFLTEPDFPTYDMPLEESMKLVAFSEARQYECLRCAFRIYACIIGSMWI